MCFSQTNPSPVSPMGEKLIPSSNKILTWKSVTIINRQSSLPTWEGRGDRLTLPPKNLHCLGDFPPQSLSQPCLSFVGRLVYSCSFSSIILISSFRFVVVIPLPYTNNDKAQHINDSKNSYISSSIEQFSVIFKS